MGWHIILVGVAYAIGAILLVLLVILPVFAVVGVLYDDGDGILPLLIATVVAWGVLAWLLSRRRVHL
jgi:hypothetical protein